MGNFNLYKLMYMYITILTLKEILTCVFLKAMVRMNTHNIRD